MRILYAINSAKVGGAENHILQLVSGLSVEHKIIVVCPRGEMVDKYIQAGAEVILDEPRFEIDPLFILRMFRLLRSRRIEIAHAHELMAASNITLAGFLARTPVRLIHIHSPISGWKVPFYKKFLNLIANFLLVNLLATKAIALMASIKRERIRGEWILPSKIVVIPNGIDVKYFSRRDGVMHYRKTLLDKLNLPETTYLVGSLGRLTEEKGIEVLLESVHLLKDKAPSLFTNCHFLVAGEGHLRKKLEDWVEKKGLASKITFLGFLDEMERPLYLQSLDLFVFPSLHEGFGYVLAEAMVAETPTLSSNLPVLEELTGEGKFGFHFIGGDPDDLAKSINEFFNSNQDAGEMVQEARVNISENFSKERFVERYQQLYAELLEVNK